MIVDVEILMHLLYISLMNVVYNTEKSEIEMLNVGLVFFCCKLQFMTWCLLPLKLFF